LEGFQAILILGGSLREASLPCAEAKTYVLAILLAVKVEDAGGMPKGVDISAVL